jgi:hypothetical protein
MYANITAVLNSVKGSMRDCSTSYAIIPTSLNSGRSMNTSGSRDVNLVSKFRHLGMVSFDRIETPRRVSKDR